ncbi:hypothetical protein Tco_1222959 [Tanacetum coccineum]
MTDTKGCGMPSNLDLVEVDEIQDDVQVILKQPFEGILCIHSKGLLHIRRMTGAKGLSDSIRNSWSRVVLNWIMRDLVQLDKLTCIEIELDSGQVACISMRTEKQILREIKIRRKGAWNSGNKDGSRTGKKEDSKALVTIDGEGVDWTSHSEEDEDYALMACNSSESDTEGDHRYDGILSYENEVLESVFMNKEMSEPVVNESNIECQPKVWSDAPIIEEYESDSEDE